MTDRSELANRIECSLYLGTLTGRDRDIILDALRAPALPSEEEIAKTFYLGMYEREGANWSANESQNVWLSGARAVLALLGKTGGEK